MGTCCSEPRDEKKGAAKTNPDATGKEKLINKQVDAQSKQEISPAPVVPVRFNETIQKTIKNTLGLGKQNLMSNQNIRISREQ